MGQYIGEVNGFYRQAIFIDIALQVQQAGRICRDNIFRIDRKGIIYFLLGHSG